MEKERLLDAKNKKTEYKEVGEICRYKFKEQYGHNEEVYVLKQKHLEIVTTEDRHFDDIIINFMMKFFYETSEISELKKNQYYILKSYVFQNTFSRLHDGQWTESDKDRSRVIRLTKKNS